MQYILGRVLDSLNTINTFRGIFKFSILLPTYRLHHRFAAAFDAAPFASPAQASNPQFPRSVP